MSAAIKPRGGSAKERSVFVGNIPYDVTEEQLREIFSEVGSVVNFRLVTDRETGKPKGYGFCEYADGATALSAMRNLNGYEVNGRNLRVDFADGGDKTSGGGGGSGGPGGSTGTTGFGENKAPSGVSGEALINAIENAITKFGPVKLFDMLVQLKEHARQRPDHTKAILTANPALTHAIVQCFKTLNIPIPPPSETQAGLLSAPLLPPPGMARPMQGGVLPVPQRSPLHTLGPGGGILGMAPPGIPVSQPPILAAPPAPSKPGSRWSSRPGPLATAAPVVTAPPQHMAPPASQPPVFSHPPPQQAQAGLMPTPQVPASSTQRSRDPRQRARDPRLAKRPADSEPAHDDKRVKTEEGYHAPQTNEYDAIAALARDMTPDKLNLLPLEERQLIQSYMQQHGIKLEYPH